MPRISRRNVPIDECRALRGISQSIGSTGGVRGDGFGGAFATLDASFGLAPSGSLRRLTRRRRSGDIERPPREGRRAAGGTFVGVGVVCEALVLVTKGNLGDEERRPREYVVRDESCGRPSVKASLAGRVIIQRYGVLAHLRGMSSRCSCRREVIKDGSGAEAGRRATSSATSTTAPATDARPPEPLSSGHEHPSYAFRA